MSLPVDTVEIKKKIDNCETLKELEVMRLEYLGKKGLLPSEMKLLGKLPIDQKKIKGQELNKLKTFIEDSFNYRKILIENTELEKKLKNESIDVTLPHIEEVTGKIHPISQTIFSITEIFGNLNYSVEAGPDIESDFNNFSALNIPPHHPAREMQDTFYINNSNGEDNVLRTHTSPVQVRTMLKSKPPIKIIVPGRTYRSDSDSTHTPMFHQVEGLVVNKDATMADLKSTLILFLKEFFEIDNLKYRFRPSYFPFTEPSAEMDVAYTKKNNVLKIGEGDDWLEILGCGMVNPKVLENCNIDSSIYQGFAFGMGIERLSMLKYGITDMRGLFDLNLKWLDHYGFSPLDLKTRSEV
jgi:phenylalanyl-tRNA synthetase alpha chain